MAPFRGRGGRGGSKGGGSRGGRGGRGGNRGGQASRGNGRLARSGIKTKSGYRTFDSQRVKDVESEDSGDDLPEMHEEVEDDVEESSDEEEIAPAAKSYNALIASFKPSRQENGRSRKRRKIAVEAEESAAEDSEGSVEDEDAGFEVAEDEASDEDVPDADAVPNTSHGADEPDEEEADSSDPFEIHFANPDGNELSRRLKSIQAQEWKVEKQALRSGATCAVSSPKCVESAAVRKPSYKALSDLPLKERLSKSAEKTIKSLDSDQQSLAPYIFNYQDVMAGNRTTANASSFRDLACLHSINHILKGRDKVLKNNARLAQSAENVDAQDQGFTRPKVLILLETRQMCAKYAEAIANLFQPDQQENKKRFEDSFTAPVDDNSPMPEDFQELFAGNNDNNFLTAIKFTRKTLKFYSGFYNSDIILASPLGLRRVIENEDLKKRDYDFLSSVEIAILDQADAMQMQNWENVETVFSHLNLQLREAHNCDFSRVRNYYLDGNAKYLRQTLVFSAYITPEMNRFFNISLLNNAGKAKITHVYTGAIANAGGLGIKQTFSRFDSASPASDPDARFKYFTIAVLPSLLRLPKPADGGQGILIFVPSYYDFLRVRNFFATDTLMENTSFGAIHDYTAPADQRRARSHFLSGRHSILLYTQRAHHFFRLRIKGVKRVVCYGVPDNALFYEEMVGGFLGTSLEEGRTSAEESGCRVMFSKWDGLRLSRVVGDERVRGMLGGRGDTFDFV